MNLQDLWVRLGELYQASTVDRVTLVSSGVALATTPLAFAVLGRMKWFQARRGRSLQTPAFWSVVCSMLLIMGVPAIVLAILVKSEHFDKNRYEFDPNQPFSVADQGRQYEAWNLLDATYKLDEAVRAEQERLAKIRKELTDGVKKVDDAMLVLRESARGAPRVIAPLNGVLESLGSLRKAVAIDAPQQLVNLTAEPAAIASSSPGTAASAPAMATNVPPPAVAAPPAAAGLARPEIEAILASTPEPQKPLVQMLPLEDLPAGWELSKLPVKGAVKYVESFNADNLFEKMDGGAESYIQNGVKGMACCSYHPKGNPDGEVQLFVFEMGDPLKARGKFDAEKPDKANPVPIGEGAYVADGSVFVHANRYYTVASIAQNDPKLAEFSKYLATRVAGLQAKEKSSGPSSEDLFSLLPGEPKKSGTKYVAKDVFGYSFLSDVFLADYEVEDMTFQGFLRPYATAEEAIKIFDQYVETAKKDGAEIKVLENSKAEKMVLSSNIGLIDVVFVKGNAVGGANGASTEKPAEEFARKFAESLPAQVPLIGGSAEDRSTEKSADAEKEEP